jgi:dephospho-CoA kinase
VCLDAPLLFETKVLEHICYPIIVVHLNDEIEVKMRLMHRNQLTREEADQKISAQMPIKVKVNKADLLIENGQTLLNLEQHIKT